MHTDALPLLKADEYPGSWMHWLNEENSSRAMRSFVKRRNCYIATCTSNTA